jgi:CelD/BcsL family acetyltransferase involved in cellulose biosynthesis
MTMTSSSGAQAALVVQEHRSIESFRQLQIEWRALEAYAATPFGTWDWAVAWWAQLREEKLGVTDSLSIRTVRTQEGRLVAVAPMLISRRPSLGPIRVRQLQFFGADPNITEQRGLLALPGWQGQAYRALLDHALEHAGDWDCMLLSGVPVDLDFGAPQRSPDFEWRGQTADYTLALPSSWEAFRAALPRNIKESLRKCYNSPKRDGLEFRLEVADKLDAVEPALEQFFQLHAARAQLKDTIAHNDAFATQEAREFLKDVCRRFAERDALRIFQLRHGKRVVAVRIGFIAGDTLYLYYSGYDPEFAHYSVMTTTVAEAIQYGIKHRFSKINLSTGKDVSKARWGPSEHVTRHALVMSSSRRAKITHHMYRQALHAIDAMPALRRATTFLARRSPPPSQAFR